ncbi:MAG: GNAT family N-acetyltransferase [Bacilli bacterium]|nr:GNAT family N-acetyltransferase [Bacilli bacterium]
MFQEIPAHESGATNLCHGISFKVFHSYLEQLISNKYLKINKYGTPTVTYIMYVNQYPIGYVGIRTAINEDWLKWSGNVYYSVRPSERNKGYATEMLSLGLLELKKLGFKEAYVQSAKENVGSSKVIEKNGGILLKDDGTKYYKILIL